MKKLEEEMQSVVQAEARCRDLQSRLDDTEAHNTLLTNEWNRYVQCICVVLSCLHDSNGYCSTPLNGNFTNGDWVGAGGTGRKSAIRCRWRTTNSNRRRLKRNGRRSGDRKRRSWRTYRQRSPISNWYAVGLELTYSTITLML